MEFGTCFFPDLRTSQCIFLFFDFFFEYEEVSGLKLGTLRLRPSKVIKKSYQGKFSQPLFNLSFVICLSTEKHSTKSYSQTSVQPLGSQNSCRYLQVVVVRGHMGQRQNCGRYKQVVTIQRWS